MPSSSAKATQPRSFPVYDNMFYIGKPDTEQYGLIPSNIIDDGHIWPHGQNYGYYRAAVRSTRSSLPIWRIRDRSSSTSKSCR
jgi:hypothetical protein